MGFRRFFRKLIGSKAKARKSWRQRYAVGRGTYGEPAILHWGEPATLRVGAFCSIADDVRIFLGGNHRLDWITTYPLSMFRPNARPFDQKLTTTRGDVTIGHDVWIGHGASIMSGVRIGNGAAVGAYAVVTRDVPAYGIVAGNPARLIRHRFDDDQIAWLERIAWWDWPDEVLDAAIPILQSADFDGLKAYVAKHLPALAQEAAQMGDDTTPAAPAVPVIAAIEPVL